MNADIELQKMKYIFRCQYSSKRKYSLKEGNLALPRLDERTDDGRECSSEREREDTAELGNGVVEELDKQVKLESDDKSTQKADEEEEEEGDYFQDPTDICKYLYIFSYTSFPLYLHFPSSSH